LLTVSVIQRELILKPMAYALQLREISRGEVELTSSAVRLLLTGSRGIAVTFLWYSAMDKQKKNQWHELELLVRSITKLQPYFITPWLHLSWNLSFNVAVECDQPRDKYYYISRGLQLLAEGERRNRGTLDERAAPDKSNIFPGNPDMRYYMGFYYQLKMGTSDERLTMRCLLELSCIDPVEKDVKLFLTHDEKGREQVKLEKFAVFCQQYPRLIRRLKEQLGKENPYDIVLFLKRYQDIPHRFKPIDNVSTQVQYSKLKEVDEQFPILPPHEDNDWPNRNELDLTGGSTKESVDVFLICRTWYEFAQKPLPPPTTDPEKLNGDYDKIRYRIPKQMVVQLFRHYPSRAQVYIAETLESEGFFDSEGWIVPDWFDSLTDKPNSHFGDADGRFVVGQDRKYHSQLAWAKSYEMYRNFGRENGIYIEPALAAELDKKAEAARIGLGRDGRKLHPSEMPTGDLSHWRTGEAGESLRAHLRLKQSEYLRRLANFDAFMDQAEAEKDPMTACMRKLLFQAERRRKRFPADILALQLYEQAWPLYIQVCLDHPKFAQVGSMQEDLYEIHQRYLGVSQRMKQAFYKRLGVWVAARSFGPSALMDWHDTMGRYWTVNRVEKMPTDVFTTPSEWLAYRSTGFPLAMSWPAAAAHEYVATTSVPQEPAILENQAELGKVTPFRLRRGPLDAVRYYDGPNAKELRESLFAISYGQTLAMSPQFASSLFVYPGRVSFMLTQGSFKDEPLQPGWKRLITDETHRIIELRLGIYR
jgi:hypothetical protein